MTMHSAGDPVKVALPPKLDTAAAAGLAETLASNRGHDLVLDATAVEMIGGRCLEVLLRARHHWKEDGFRVRVAGLSGALDENLAHLGLTRKILSEGPKQ